MKTNPPGADGLLSKFSGALSRRPFIFFFALLLAVLGFLFSKAFHPDFVTFSNDGPLGLNSAEYNRCSPDYYKGIWCDLNWVGFFAGNGPVGVSGGLYALLGPLYLGKFYALISLLIVGTGGWFFFRQLGLGAVASLLAGLATALTPDFFCDACWGTAGHPLCYGLNFFALGLVVSRQNIPPWARYPLAGFFVGMGVVEGADIGAIFSVFSAAFIVFHAFVTNTGMGRRIVQGGLRAGVVAAFAGLIAASAVLGWVGTQIQGVAGTQQDTKTKEERWEWASWGSFPKSELPGLVIPGLFGYRLQGFDEGQPPQEVYWGKTGRDASWDRYFDSGKQGPQPQGMIRWGSGAGYVGIFVAMIAFWALLQSFRKNDSLFSVVERKHIWFWAAAGLVAMLLAFGRYAPFYKLLYSLPYASTVRIPSKYLHVMNWSLLVMFAFGLYGLGKRCLDAAAPTTRDIFSQLQAWWKSASAFDRRWVKLSWLAIAACAAGWFFYSSNKPALVEHLQEVQFDAERAAAIASFSINQVGVFLVFLAVAVGLLTLVLSGCFTGRRVVVGVLLMAIFLTVDLTRVGARWVDIYNWKARYVEAATNPVLDALRQRPFEQRVAVAPYWLPMMFRSEPVVAQAHNVLQSVYGKEWKQHLFQYYNIQSLDVIQMSRQRQEIVEFETALNFDGNPANLYKVGRRWQLTNTRYILCAAGYFNALPLCDPEQKRFRPVMPFEFYQMRADGPILTRTNLSGQQHPLALIEFTGALPRAKLYSNWQVVTNDQAALTQLATKDFDPAQTVLVSDPIPAPRSETQTNATAGSVTHESYTPQKVALKAKAEASCVLLLNDKHDAFWKVYVDGKEAPLLRCNYIMRGVQLEKGEHTVEFRFEPKLRFIHASLAADALTLLLIGVVVAGWKRGGNLETAAKES